jgi:hypothetical protein
MSFIGGLILGSMMSSHKHSHSAYSLEPQEPLGYTIATVLFCVIVSITIGYVLSVREKRNMLKDAINNLVYCTTISFIVENFHPQRSEVRRIRNRINRRIEALENTVKQKEIVIEEKDAQIEVQDATIDKISNIQDTYSLRQAKGNLLVTEGNLKEYLFAKKWFQYLSNGKSGAEKKNTMQATVYAVGRNFAKDVNVENRKQQRFFKQFRITRHGMAFLIKHRNEYAK